MMWVFFMWNHVRVQKRMDSGALRILELCIRMLNL